MNRVRRIYIAAVFLGGLILGRGAADAGESRLPEAAPESVGMSSDVLREMEFPIELAIRRGEIPGCVVLIARKGKVVWHRAYGQRTVEPQPTKLTTDAVFDMASITKPVATATAIMQLVEQGHLALEEPVARYLPEFGQNGKESITIRQLLTHHGGLIADNPLADYVDGPVRAWERICQLRPEVKPGSRFTYSDVGFITLGKLVESVTGETLANYVRRQIFQPLGMHDTGFVPDEDLRARAVPTEKRDGQWLQGVVHDPRAAALNGIAGHAGLFSTSSDLAIYAQMMLNWGSHNGRQILRPQSVVQMTAAVDLGGDIRGLGWDKRSTYSTNRGDLLSDAAFGHGGFTGTVLWTDPELELFYIVLSSRLYPDGDGLVNPLAGRIGTLAAMAVRLGEKMPEGPKVLTGIDVLQQEQFAPLRGARIGLITNHTGINRDGDRTLDILHAAPQVTLVRCFSPEHGPQGASDQAHITDSQDEKTGIAIHSLYGPSRRPRVDSLEGIDTFVFDIQDIGTRYYTYISTMKRCMQSAAEHSLRFVVLDRPNPLGGVHVRGPLLDAGQESFVACHRLPIQHGMTIGELAQMFRAELKLDLDLHVVWMRNWKRSMVFDETGLWWVPPSPNMRTLNQAILYPGIGWLETTNLSVGRGTDTPFEIIGAPWIDGQALAEHLHQKALAGVRYTPVRFTPRSSKYAGQRCSGVQILITDRARLEPLSIGLSLAAYLRQHHRFDWDVSQLGRLWGHAHSLERLLQGGTAEEVEACFRNDPTDFARRRQPYLFYD